MLLLLLLLLLPLSSFDDDVSDEKFNCFPAHLPPCRMPNREFVMKVAMGVYHTYRHEKK